MEERYPTAMRTPFDRLPSWTMASAFAVLATACGGTTTRPVGYTPAHEFEPEEARYTEPSKAEPLLVHTPTEPIPMLGALRPPEVPADASEEAGGDDDEEDEENEEASPVLGQQGGPSSRPL